MSATARTNPATTDFDAMGLRTNNPFEWQAKPTLTSSALLKLQRKRATQRDYLARLKANATRVNEESNLGYSTSSTNSHRAPR